MSTALDAILHRCQNRTPVIMGILNVTPDSFYSGSLDVKALLQQVLDMNRANVDIIDVGAESSRPGAQPISAEDECQRLATILPHLNTNAIVSVDTYKPEVADYALRHGADMINDISGGESDALLDVVAKHHAGIVLMHKQGRPESMQDEPSYVHVVEDVHAYLSTQIQRARSHGIQTIIVDPGIGFGKRLDHNIELLQQLDVFLSLDCPILIGTSNKSFIEELTGASISNRLPGSLASVLSAYQKGANIFRVHDVPATIQALDVFRALHA